jgi:hypothetical protein
MVFSLEATLSGDGSLLRDHPWIEPRQRAHSLPQKIRDATPRSMRKFHSAIKGSAIRQTINSKRPNLSIVISILCSCGTITPYQIRPICGPTPLTKSWIGLLFSYALCRSMASRWNSFKISSPLLFLSGVYWWQCDHLSVDRMQYRDKL